MLVHVASNRTGRLANQPTGVETRFPLGLVFGGTTVAREPDRLIGTDARPVLRNWRP
jgi:hypothetical protein